MTINVKDVDTQLVEDLLVKSMSDLQRPLLSSVLMLSRPADRAALLILLARELIGLAAIEFAHVSGMGNVDPALIARGVKGMWDAIETTGVVAEALQAYYGARSNG